MFNPGGASPAVAVRPINCPSCGAAVAVRLFGHVVNVVCQSCRTLLDARTEGVTILQRYTDAISFEPGIPLGSRGTLQGTKYEVVGFQVRQVTVDGDDYRWREYLLFNPYRAFHYLTEYDGHWNFVTPVYALPHGERFPGGSTPRVFRGQTYRHFQTATASTLFVLGEFPWQVRRGERAGVADYVAPPHILSAEVAADKEVTWSLGEYLSGAELWQAFALPGRPPTPVGIYANQPSPHGAAVSRMWRQAIGLLALALLVWLAGILGAREKQAFAQALVFDPRAADAPIVTPSFALDGRASPVRIDTTSDIDNEWMFLGYSLINDQTGDTYDVGREVSYYYGVEGGEPWTEGGRIDSVTLPAVPPGRYFLRIEPEGEPAGRPIRYQVAVIRDAAVRIWLVAAAALILIPPIFATWRAASFERRRWAEAGGVSSESGGDGDDE
jgi:hypothetical protein